MPVCLLYENDEFDMQVNNKIVWFREFKTDKKGIERDIIIHREIFEEMIQEYDAWVAEQSPQNHA